MRTLRPRAPSLALAVSLVALVVALGGTSYAAFTLPKNSVGTTQLKNGAVTTKKIASRAVTGSKMNFTGVTVPRADHADTADNASHADAADNASALGGATLGSLTLARGTTGSCHPASVAFVDCGTVALALPRSGRVLILANVGYDGSNTNGYRGDCRLQADGTTVGSTISFGQAGYVASGGVTVVGGPGYNANGQEGGGLNAVTGPLPAGTHNFALQCDQAGGTVEFSSTSVSAVMLASG
jgi:hypothetical protein